MKLMGESDIIKNNNLIFRITMYGLNFISDDDLISHVRDTVQKYRFQIDLRTLNENLIDPIKLTFDAGVYQGNFSNDALIAVLENEVLRQIDKSNTNHIGYFHQNIFKFIGKENGWIVPAQGFDVENRSRKIYVEMKNKHNTMNSSSSAKTYMRMQNKLLNENDAVCYLVETIARHSQDIVWCCTLDGQKMSHEHIRRMSMDKFYELVTGEQTAFLQLCQILPTVIQDVLAQTDQNFIENTVVADLQREQAENILGSLYLLAFKHYQGFEHFQFR